jgi:hypothetical protein
MAINKSGQLPAGDARLCVNVRKGVHLKLKLAAIHRNTTCGELLEELIIKHLPDSPTTDKKTFWRGLFDRAAIRTQRKAA